MVGGESLGRCPIRERDNTRRAAVEIHRDRLSVAIEHLVRTNAGDHVAAFHGEGIGRTQRATRLVVGQLLKSNWFVRLGAGAERAGWTTEHFALAAHPRNGSHVGVNRASTGLTSRHPCVRIIARPPSIHRNADLGVGTYPLFSGSMTAT